MTKRRNNDQVTKPARAVSVGFMRHGTAAAGTCRLPEESARWSAQASLTAYAADRAAMASTSTCHAGSASCET